MTTDAAPNAHARIPGDDPYERGGGTTRTRRPALRRSSASQSRSGILISGYPSTRRLSCERPERRSMRRRDREQPR